MEEMKREKPLLKKGKKGFTKEIKCVQNILKQLGYFLGNGGIDGIFGRATHDAVINFQKNQGLKTDGIVGEKTWIALEKEEIPFLENPQEYSTLNSDGEDIGPRANVTILDLEREDIIALRKKYHNLGYQTEISYG